MALKNISIFGSLLLGASALFPAQQPMVMQGEPMLSQSNDPEEQIIGPFGTLNNRDNPATIPSNKSQDLLNVDITPGGKSFKKRFGYGLAYALTVTTSPIHGAYDFFDLNSNDFSLTFNDTYMTSSQNGGSPTVLFSTGPFGATYQCTDSQGFAYCVDTNRDPIIKTNGVTYSQITPTNNGTMISYTFDRLVLSGFSNRPNDIDFSGSLAPSSWTVSVLVTSPYSFTILSPGSHITHIAWAFNRIMWWKDSSFGYLYEGSAPNASDWQIQTISPNIGTLDNSDVYWQGILYFRGQDGHIYSYDGSTLQKLSSEIEGTIALCQKRTSNLWTQTTAADFGAGGGTNVDTTTVPGQVQLTLNSSSAKDSCYSADNASTGFTCDFSQMYGYRSFTATSNYLLASVMVRLKKDAGSTANFTMDLMGDNSGKPSTTVLVSTTVPAASVGFTVTDTTFTFNTSSLYQIVSGTRYWIRVRKDCLSDFPSFYWFYPNPVCDASEFHQLCLNCSTQAAGAYKYQANGTSFVSIGTFTSAVNNAPSLSAWDTFNTTQLNNNQSQSFFIRASTNIFSVSSSTPAYVPLTVGSVPSTTTGTYFQIKDIMTTSTNTQTPILYDFTQHWFDGSASDKSYATYYKDAIWFTVTYGSGATTNNRILKYDLLDQGWLIYDIPSNGFFLRYLNLYFGSSSSGNIYKYSTVAQPVYNDAGSTINAYWKSKDFIGNSPFQNEELRNVSIYYSVQNSTINATYTVNGSSASTYSIYMYGSPTQSFNNSNKSIQQGTVGNSFNLSIGNNAADQPFEIMAERLGLNPKPWNPTPAGQ